MLELRYNGCADCLNTAKSLLRNAGMFSGRDYRVEFHKEHLGDRIYSKRPDYIKIFSGAIIYNPETESWLDVYDQEHSHCILCDIKTNELNRLLYVLKGKQAL